MPGADALIGALKKLNAKNLSNLTPHPVYSGFYYSHPTLLEREAALTGASGHSSESAGGGSAPWRGGVGVHPAPAGWLRL